MVKIIDFSAARHKDNDMRNEMLGLLAKTTERVRSGEVTGLVILQTTEGSVTYNSAAGFCCSNSMLGLIHSTGVQIANMINDQSEDLEA